MSDLVDRLRDIGCDREPFTPDHAECQCRVAGAAADEITKLRTVVENAIMNLRKNTDEGVLLALDILETC